MSCGFFYILMGLFAATLTSILLAFPAVFITALAGIALLGTIGHNITLAFSHMDEREAALLTFLFSASGCNSLASVQHSGDYCLAWWYTCSLNGVKLIKIFISIRGG